MGKTLAGPLIQDSGGVLQGSLVDPATGTAYAARARNLATAATGDTAGQEVVLYDAAGNALLTRVPNDGMTLQQALTVEADLVLFNGLTLERARSATAFGDASGITGALPTVPFLLNGSSYDRQRNNTEGTLLASAARTAFTSSADQTNYNAHALRFYLNVTGLVTAGAPQLSVIVEGKDPASGNYFALGSYALLAAAVGKYLVEVGLGAGAGVGGATYGNTGALAGRAAIPADIPRTWRLTVAPNDASTFTYSVGYSLS